MRVHLTPIVYQPVTAPRPAQKVGPAATQTVAVKSVSERTADGGKGQSRPRPDRRGRWAEIDGDDRPPVDPAASLRSTLALLDLGSTLDAAEPTRPEGLGLPRTATDP